MRILASITTALWLVGSTLHAAVVFVEPFDGPTTEGWSQFDLDVFGHSNTEGQPAGSLSGTINTPNAFVPTLGSFYANSGASSAGFTGNYTDVNRNGVGQPFSFQFDFMAATVIPGSLSLVLEGPGSTYFSFGFNLSGLSLNAWNTFQAPLEFDAAWWSGGTEGQFNTMLASVQSVEIQFNTSGALTQTYYLDNVQLSTEIIDLSAVPEPVTAQLLFLSLAALFLYRRKRRAPQVETRTSGMTT